MKIIAFCYAFPHEKSVQGLLHLKTHGYDNVEVIAAPFKQLNLPKSRTRITPKIQPLHPWDVAKALGYKYSICPHEEIKKWDLYEADLGVILGARIIKRELVNLVRIINCHPGHIPLNRGLDNLKWAIERDLPQIVTSHIIDEHIDMGTLIDEQIVDVFEDDTMLDIFLRSQNKELHMMINALKILENHKPCTKVKEKGNYNHVMNDWEDEKILMKFSNYKKNYAEICERFEKLK